MKPFMQQTGHGTGFQRVMLKVFGVLEMKKIHYCGNGFKGQVVKARGISFCGFCGKEFRK